MWPFKKEKKAEDVTLAKHIEVLAKNIQLEEQVKSLKIELEAFRKTIPIIDFDVKDPAPSDTKTREKYVAEVAVFHTNILIPKLRQMISVCHQLMEGSENPREYDMTLKGTIYALRDILFWGDKMVNEQVANQNKNNNN